MEAPAAGGRGGGGGGGGVNVNAELISSEIGAGSLK